MRADFPAGLLAVSIASALGPAASCSSTDSSGAQSISSNGGSTVGDASTGGSSAGGAGGSTNAGGTPMAGAAGSAGTCEGTAVGAPKVSSNVLLLLGRSGSMGDLVGATSKWEATAGALAAVLEGLSDELRLGIVTFGQKYPCPTMGCCARNSWSGGQPDILIKPVTPAYKDYINLWASNCAPSDALYTPTGPALEGAYDLMINAGPDGNRYVVMITDGPEDCLEGQPSQAVKNAGDGASGTPPVITYVVGLPGSEDFRGTLSEIAKQGGTPRSPTCDGEPGNACHADLTAASDLQQELQAALGSVLFALDGPCTYAIPDPGDVPFDPEEVNVRFTDTTGTQTIPQDASTDCAQAAGWKYSADQKQIILCGSACQTVQSHPGAKVEVVFGCPVQTVPK